MGKPLQITTFVSAGLAIFLTGFALHSVVRSPTAAASPPDAAIEGARAAVLAILRDPDSAHFGAFTHAGGDAVCGSVNAKNGFGGYSGLESFVYSGGAVTIFEPGAPHDRQLIEAYRIQGAGCPVVGEAAQLLRYEAGVGDELARLRSGR